MKVQFQSRLKGRDSRADAAEARARPAASLRSGPVRPETSKNLEATTCSRRHTLAFGALGAWAFSIQALKSRTPLRQ